MTTWFERRPGSEETLLALYDTVVAAEELDLEEQASRERGWSFLGMLDPHPNTAGAETNEPHAVADEDRPSMSQALGVVEHLLGGRPLGRVEPTS